MTDERATKDGCRAGDRRRRRWATFALCAAVTGGAVGLVRAQYGTVPQRRAPAGARTGAAAGASAATNAPAAGTNAAAGPVEATADTLDYNRQTGWLEGKGHVVIRKGAQELRADYVRINMQTEDAYAYGNVTFRRDKELWKGESFRYNFKSRAAEAEKLTLDAKPFRVLGVDKAEKMSTNRFLVHNAWVTSCTNQTTYCHFYIKARDLDVIPHDRMIARGAVWYFGSVPVLYSPFWRHNLNPDFGFRLHPGYSSRNGAFLLSSCYYRISPEVKGETHLDYRVKRGVAVGQDFEWQDPANRWNGDLSTYYAYDQKPIADDEDPNKNVDKDRYRIKLRNTYQPSDRDDVRAQIHYVSDAYILEDFFEDEYREQRQPENYLIYTHRGEDYTASAGVNARLNDFFENVNRLPEVSVDLLRREIDESSIFYEGRAAAAYLERVWPKDSGRQDYSAARVDVPNMLYYPDKYFGFLNLIPRAGYRATYYSKTRESIAEAVVETGTNGVVAGTNTVTRDLQKGGDVRSLVELGLEASFKSFKTWTARNGMPWRHVVEPYANYTFIPEPTLTPDELYQFDGVDQLDEENFVRFGVRNMFQAKEDTRPVDVADIDIYTDYRIHREENEEAIEDIVLDAELHPMHDLTFECQTTYNLPDAEFRGFDLRSIMGFAPRWNGQVEYLYRQELNSLVSADMTFLPTRNWNYNLYGRYEFEQSQLEEVGGYLQRNVDCFSVRLGGSVLPSYTRTDGTEADAEYRVLLSFWLNAFPDVTIGSRNRH